MKAARTLRAPVYRLSLSVPDYKKFELASQLRRGWADRETGVPTGGVRDSSLQLYIAVGLPVLAILTSLVVSLVQISGLRGEISGQISGVRREINGMVSGVRGELIGLRGEMGSIREDIRELRADVKLLTGKVYELMEHRG